MNQQKQNFTRNMMKASERLLQTRDEMETLVAQYNLEAYSSGITDEDLAESQEFEHLANSDITNCITAFQTILAALGDNSSGQATNLIKVRG